MIKRLLSFATIIIVLFAVPRFVVGKDNDREIFYSINDNGIMEYSIIIPEKSEVTQYYSAYIDTVHRKRLLSEGKLKSDKYWVNGSYTLTSQRKGNIIVRLLDKKKNTIGVVSKEYQYNKTGTTKTMDFINPFFGIVGVLVGFFINIYKEKHDRLRTENEKNQERVQNVYLALATLIDNWDLAHRETASMSKYLKPRYIRKMLAFQSRKENHHEIVTRPKIIFHEWSNCRATDNDCKELEEIKIIVSKMMIMA